MSTHIESTRSGYVLIENKTGKVIAGPTALRETLEAKIRQREKAKKENGDKPRHFIHL